MVRKPFALLAIAVLATFLLTAPKADAQVVAIAEVSGTVTDSTGAVVAQAEVRMTQTETDQTHVTQTDSSGRYALPNLPVGPYVLTVERAGFKKYVQSGIVLV